MALTLSKGIFSKPPESHLFCFSLLVELCNLKIKSTVPGEPFPKLEAISCLRKNSKLNYSPTSYVFLNYIPLSFLKQSFVKNKTRQSSA